MRLLTTYLHSNKEKLAVILDQGLVSGVNFIVAVMLARILGLDQFGLYVLGWMVVLFSSSLHQAFIVAPLYTLLPKQADKKHYLASLTALQIIYSICTFLLAYLVLSIAGYLEVDQGLATFILPISVLTALHIFNDYMRRMYFATHRPMATIVMDIIGYGLQPVAIFILHTMGLLNIETNYYILIVLMAFSSVVTVFIHYSAGLEFKHIGATLKAHWDYSKYLIGTALLQWMSGNFLLVVSAGIIGPVALGAIRIAQNIVGVLHVLFLALENIVPLKASELLHTSGKPSMLRYMGKMSQLAGAITAVLLLLIAVFSTQILGSLYGTTYLAYSNLLIGFTGLYVLVFIGTILRFIIRTVEKNQTIFWSYVATAAVSLLFAGPLVRQFDIAGVLIGFFALQLISLSIFIYTLRSEITCLYR